MKVDGNGCSPTLTLFMFGNTGLEMRWNISPECLGPNPFWISDIPECRDLNS